jgi:hypothetical protein
MPFAGLLPQAGEVVSSTRPDPRAVCRSIGRSGLAARPAGPVEAVGRLVFPGKNAVQAPPLSGADHERAPDGSVDRGCVGSASGSFAPVCDPRGLAFVFPSAARSCLGLWPLSGLTGAAATWGVHDRAGANVPPRSTVRPAAALPRPYPLMGFASEVSASRRMPASNTDLVVCRVAIGASTVRGLLRDVTRQSPPPLTSLQRIKRPMPCRSACGLRACVCRCAVRREPAPCLRFCTVRAEMKVRHGEVRQPI